MQDRNKKVVITDCSKILKDRDFTCKYHKHDTFVNIRENSSAGDDHRLQLKTTFGALCLA